MESAGHWNADSGDDESEMTGWRGMKPTRKRGSIGLRKIVSRTKTETLRRRWVSITSCSPV